MTASVRFGSDEEPGVRRRGEKPFTYVVDKTGRSPSRVELDRIRRLAIPPAWTDVWIAADANSHVQATGRDARGRKQYRYHPVYVSSRAENKFGDLVQFAAGLGDLRRQVTRDLRGDDVGHDRVVATIVRLLDVTSLRVGNAEYSRTNGSYGLTTLRNGHVVVRGSTIRFTFRGKSAHDFDISIADPRLAKIVRSCQHLPGQRLFEYRAEDGQVRTIGSGDVNDYLREHASFEATAKTFRTWNATVFAAEGLARAASREEDASVHTLNETIDEVAAHLGNTRSVCRNSYVHPAIVDSYLLNELPSAWSRPPSTRPSGLSVVERKTLRILRRAR